MASVDCFGVLPAAIYYQSPLDYYVVPFHPGDLAFTRQGGIKTLYSSTSKQYEVDHFWIVLPRQASNFSYRHKFYKMFYIDCTLLTNKVSRLLHLLWISK